MKTSDKTKSTVLGVGLVAVATSFIGAIYNMSVVEFLFPMYFGLVLIGSVLLHKETPACATHKQ